MTLIPRSQQFLSGVRCLLATAVQTQSSNCVCSKPQGMLGMLQVRHVNKGGKNKRVKDAKVQADRGKKFLSKSDKKKKSFLLSNASEEKSSIMADNPVDNVWIRKYYPRPTFHIEEALNRHKAFAQPAMLDNMEGLAYLDMLLDFRTKKQTKFLKNVRSTVLLPFPFNWGPPPSILVFCKEEEHTNLALALGARHAGTPAEIIKAIENGVVNPKDFTHVLATADCAMDITPARSYFRDKFPQRIKGNIGTDLEEMWNLFYTGYTYETHNLTEAQGRLQVPLGQLNQPTSELVSNFETFLDSICKHRSLALGPFVLSMGVVAPPSPEEFLVKVEEYVPGYKNEEIDSDDEEGLLEEKS